MSQGISDARVTILWPAPTGIELYSFYLVRPRTALSISGLLQSCSCTLFTSTTSKLPPRPRGEHRTNEPLLLPHPSLPPGLEMAVIAGAGCWISCSVGLAKSQSKSLCPRAWANTQARQKNTNTQEKELFRHYKQCGGTE